MSLILSSNSSFEIKNLPIWRSAFGIKSKINWATVRSLSLGWIGRFFCAIFFFFKLKSSIKTIVVRQHRTSTKCLQRSSFKQQKMLSLFSMLEPKTNTIFIPVISGNIVISIRGILYFISILNIIVPCGLKQLNSSPGGVQSTILIFGSSLEKKKKNNPFFI